MILAVTGTNGSGKGTVHEYLKTKGFTHYSARSLIVEEIEKRKLSINRDTMNEVGNDLRKTQGPEYIAKTLYERAAEHGGNAVIESIRAIKEAEYLQKNGVTLVAIDANKKVRYARAVLRSSHTDCVSFDEFVDQENRELAQTAEYDMNIKGVMDRADYMLNNDGTLEDFHKALDDMIAEIKKEDG